MSSHFYTLRDLADENFYKQTVSEIWGKQFLITKDEQPSPAEIQCGFCRWDQLLRGIGNTIKCERCGEHMWIECQENDFIIIHPGLPPTASYPIAKLHAEIYESNKFSR
jgi:hypothetical protein